MWTSKYPFDTWNILEMADERVKLLNRTNNPLESYNRCFGEQFPAQHPDFFHFVEIAKEESVKMLRRYNDVRSGVEEGPDRARVAYPTVPEHLQ
jgi:hypothetical protein